MSGRFVYLGEAKVDDADVARLVKHQILWRKVAVDNAARMHVPQRQHDARRVEARVPLGHAMVVERVHHGAQLSAHARLDEHVERLGVVPARGETCDERVVKREEVLLLVEQVLHLVLQHHLKRRRYKPLRAVRNAGAASSSGDEP